jgi:hypothetical protein
MKTKCFHRVAGLFLLSSLVVNTALAQGVVRFSQTALPTPPDRTVRDACGEPLVGTNYIAQLYYGATADALTPHPDVSRFRPPGTFPAGTWLGGTRTLNGVGGVGTTVFLQVKVWDILSGATFDQAQASGGPWGESTVFPYTQALSMPPAADDTSMKNFVGFSLVLPRCPPTNVLTILNDNNTISLTFAGSQNLEVSQDLRTWTTLGVRQSPFVDSQAALLSHRFYRMNDNGVYSFNAVGFYRLALCAGFSLIANQLDRGDNKVTQLIPNPPNGTRAYKFNPSAMVFENLNYADGVGWDDGSSGTINMTAHPGEGIFVYSVASFTNTFFGEIRMLTSIPVRQGFSILSSPVPQTGPIEPPPPIGLNFPVQDGDQFYQWDCANGYYIFNEFVAGLGWIGDTGVAPFISIGEAFWLFRSSAGPGTWNRSFNVGP